MTCSTPVNVVNSSGKVYEVLARRRDRLAFDKKERAVLQDAPSMISCASIQKMRRSLRCGVTVGLVVLLLALAPFAVAQDVHHELAAADHDGHEHSDNDLCQWVQHHTTGSLVVAIPPPVSWAAISEHQWCPVTCLVSSSFLAVGPSRAPPRS